jgi:hypothetical protein
MGVPLTIAHYLDNSHNPPSVFSFLELTLTFMKDKSNCSDKRKSISKLIKAKACKHCPTAKIA